MSVGRVHAGAMDTFPLLLTLALVLAVGLALGALIGVLWSRSRPDDDVAVAALQQRVADHAVVQDGLERLQDQLSDLAHDRVAWQAQLHQQVADVRLSTDTLRRETSTLAARCASRRCAGSGASSTCAAPSSSRGWSTTATSPSRCASTTAGCGPTSS